MNTFLRWAGSKRKLLPVLLGLAPRAFDRYVEPFAGSACFFFSLQPQRAVLGDINDELMNTYREVKKRPEEVIDCLSDLKPSKTDYYRVRALDKECPYFTEAEQRTLLEYCKRADPNKPKGFGQAGVVVVFAHRCPNNSIPILHVTNDNWQGLFPRHDE